MWNIGRNMCKGVKIVVNVIYKIIMTILVSMTLIIWGFIGWSDGFSQAAQDRKLQEIYHKIVAATGQTQEALPLVIDEGLEDNAYNDGTKVVIYRGLIDHTTSWDEIAMVLGHEVAHGMLWHLKFPLQELDNNQISVLEANADKMGAFYMMKVGYNICKGRQLFKYWKEEHGNALGQDHPDYSYRYDELNIGCDY